MSVKLLLRLLIGYKLFIKVIWESEDPKHFYDVTFMEPIPFTIGYKEKQINSGQFPEEIMYYLRFSPTEFRLYFISI